MIGKTRQAKHIPLPGHINWRNPRDSVTAPIRQETPTPPVVLSRDHSAPNPSLNRQFKASLFYLRCQAFFQFCWNDHT